MFRAYPVDTLVGSVRSRGMADDESLDAAVLGHCPDCGADIPTERLLARFLTADERARVLAECPACAGIGPPVGAGGEG